MTITKDNLVME